MCTLVFSDPRQKTIVYKTGPVRGMQRMNLQGWDCEDCKKVIIINVTIHSPKESSLLVGSLDRYWEIGPLS